MNINGLLRQYFSSGPTLPFIHPRIGPSWPMHSTTEPGPCWDMTQRPIALLSSRAPTHNLRVLRRSLEFALSGLWPWGSSRTASAEPAGGSS